MSKKQMLIMAAIAAAVIFAYNKFPKVGAALGKTA